MTPKSSRCRRLFIPDVKLCCRPFGSNRRRIDIRWFYNRGCNLAISANTLAQTFLGSDSITVNKPHAFLRSSACCRFFSMSLIRSRRQLSSSTRHFSRSPSTVLSAPLSLSSSLRSARLREVLPNSYLCFLTKSLPRLEPSRLLSWSP